MDVSGNEYQCKCPEMGSNGHVRKCRDGVGVDMNPEAFIIFPDMVGLGHLHVGYAKAFYFLTVSLFFFSLFNLPFLSFLSFSLPLGVSPSLSRFIHLSVFLFFYFLSSLLSVSFSLSHFCSLALAVVLSWSTAQFSLLCGKGESDAECASKTAYAQEHGLSVMGCIGESKEERESG